MLHATNYHQTTILFHLYTADVEVSFNILFVDMLVAGNPDLSVMRSCVRGEPLDSYDPSGFCRISLGGQPLRSVGRVQGQGSAQGHSMTCEARFFLLL